MGKDITRELVTLTEALTAPEIVELTDAEMAAVFGGTPPNKPGE